MSSFGAKRWTAGLIAGAAVVAGVVFAAPANADVRSVNCPSNGVTIYSTHNGHNCWAGFGSPPSGVASISIQNPQWISSVWNHGYSNYWDQVWDQLLDTNVAYYANGVQYNYDSTAVSAYSVVISA